MKRFFPMAAVLLTAAAAFAQYTNVLENGTAQTVTNLWNADTVWVGATTPGNSLDIVAGGMVTSSNVLVGASSNATGNAVSVTGGGRWDIASSLELGPGAGNTVSVAGGGMIASGSLLIQSNNTFNLDDGGTLAITSDFDASANGFAWNDSGHLSVGGILSGMEVVTNAVFLDGGRDLTLDGGSWTNGSHDLIVGRAGPDSSLTIAAGGRVQDANGYIGWGSASSNNAVTVAGAGSEWRNSGGVLYVGVNSGPGNTLAVSNQAWVYVGEIGTSDFAAGTNGGIAIGTIGDAELVVGGGGAVSTEGDLVIGGTALSMQGSLSVSSNGTVSAQSLILNAGNAMAVSEGGSVLLGSGMSIYSNASVSGSGTISFGTNDALLAFHGNGIELDTNLLFAADAAADNTLSYTDSGIDLSTFNDAQFINFDTLALQDTDLTGSGALTAFGSVTMAGGMIDPAGDDPGTIEIGGSFSASGTTYRAQVQTSGYDELVFSGATPVDLSGLSLDLLVSGTATGAVSILSSAAGTSNSFASAAIVSRPLLYSATLLETNGAIQVVLEVDDATVISSMLDYAAVESVRAGFSGMKNMVFTRARQLRRNLVSTDNAIPNEVFLLTTTNAPDGALGPGDQNKIFERHIWVQHYSGQGDYDRLGATDPFSLNNNGTTIGADRLVGEALTVGFNYTYARSRADASGGDRLESETYWLGAYGEWVGLEGLYLDALAAYGYTSVESERFADSYHGRASYNSQALGASADMGQYYYYGSHLALSPYMGLHALMLFQQAYNEVEDAGSVVRVDPEDHSWLESALGLKVRHRFDTPAGRFQTTGYAEWSYDFIQDEVYSSMSSGGLAAKETDRISPDESGIQCGIGFSWTCTDYMEIGIGYNGRFSDHFEEHIGSMMFDIMF